MNERTGEQTNIWTNERVNKRKNELTNGWINERMNKGTSKRMHKQTNEIRMHKHMDEQSD